MGFLNRKPMVDPNHLVGKHHNATALAAPATMSVGSEVPDIPLLTMGGEDTTLKAIIGNGERPLRSRLSLLFSQGSVPTCSVVPSPTPAHPACRTPPQASQP